MRDPALLYFFFFNDTATTEIYTLSLHDALPIFAIAPVSRVEGALQNDLAAIRRVVIEHPRDGQLDRPVRGRQRDAVAAPQRELPGEGLRHDHPVAVDRLNLDRGGVPVQEEIPAVPQAYQEIPGDHPYRPVAGVHADVAIAIRRHDAGQRLQALVH